MVKQTSFSFYQLSTLGRKTFTKPESLVFFFVCVCAWDFDVTVGDQGFGKNQLVKGTLRDEKLTINFAWPYP